MGNVGTLISFRVGSFDARYLEDEFLPVFSAIDLENIEKHQIYLKMAIDGLSCRPFSARTLPPTLPLKKENNKRNVIKSSRERYSMKREVIEKKINKWTSNF